MLIAGRLKADASVGTFLRDRFYLYDERVLREPTIYGGRVPGQIVFWTSLVSGGSVPPESLISLLPEQDAAVMDLTLNVVSSITTPKDARSLRKASLRLRRALNTLEKTARDGGRPLFVYGAVVFLQDLPQLLQEMPQVFQANPAQVAVLTNLWEQAEEAGRKLTRLENKYLGLD